MADAAAEARIRDLKRRLQLDPGSRLFVALAEEYRKSGRIAEALSTLQKGQLAHPNYLSAQVALGRVYLEAGLTRDAIATFSKTLVADPGNLVAAKSLADIYLSRGESLEAIKKFKLYRALSGDRSVDEIIDRLDAELTPTSPLQVTGSSPGEAPPPPPTFFDAKRARASRPSRDPRFAPQQTAASASRDRLDDTSVKFEPDDSSGKRGAGRVDPAALLSRDAPLPSGSSTSVSPGRAGSAHNPSPPSPSGALANTASPAEDPKGRVLADLYFAQGRYTEALRIYDDLVAATPFDEDLKRMRRDAEARLLPAGSTPGASSSDFSLERRLGKIRALKRWLSVVQPA